MYFVYILLCRDGSYYTGTSNDPQKRFQAHLNGKGGAYTRSHKPEKVVYVESLKDKSEALKREIELKKWSKLKKEALIRQKSQLVPGPITYS